MRFHAAYSVLVCLLVAAVPAAREFPFDSVLARGDSCLAIVWTPDSVHTKNDWYIRYGSLCTGGDTVYRHCDFSPGVTYRSIPYSYGGEDPYGLFREKLIQGFLVGSHLCHYESFGDPSPAIAGTDCSGFVCYAWNLPRTNTHGLLSDTSLVKIPKSMLGPGDILVKGGSHTVLVVDKDDSTHFIIWESTSAVNGCRERAIDLTDGAWAPYGAVRNPSVSLAAIPGFSWTEPPRPARFQPVPHWRARTLRLRFGRPFSGELLLYDCTGRRVGSKTVGFPTGSCAWTLPYCLPNGVFGIVLKSAGGYHETAICTVIR